MADAELAKEMARNEALRAKLTELKPAAATSVGSGAAVKAQKKMEVLGMQKNEEGLKQKIEKKELQVQHLLHQMKEDKEDLKKLNEEMDAVRNSGKAVWETVGFLTHPYHDPFHTGLSKRTPTGASRGRAVRTPRHAAP
eukprot:2620022-Prymnesium_polylepis.1